MPLNFTTVASLDLFFSLAKWGGGHPARPAPPARAPEGCAVRVQSNRKARRVSSAAGVKAEADRAKRQEENLDACDPKDPELPASLCFLMVNSESHCSRCFSRSFIFTSRSSPLDTGYFHSISLLLSLNYRLPICQRGCRENVTFLHYWWE